MKRVPVCTGSFAWYARSLCVLVILSVLSQAAYSADEGGSPSRARQPGWSAGPLLLVIDQPYRGKSTRVLVVPAVGYEGDHVFLRGLRIGLHLKSGVPLTLDFILQPRFAAFKASDITSIPGLEDRRDSMDAGLDMRVALPGAGSVGVSVLTDVLGRSNGQELDLRYEYSLRTGRTRIAPWVGGRWLSGELAAYYYGTLPSEVDAGAPYYRPGAVILPQVGVSLFTPVGHSKWMAFALLATSFFPQRLSDSPLVDGDTASTFIVGLSYHF